MNDTANTFLTERIMAGEDWRGLELAIIRLLAHCGWVNIQDVGESGDKGADILAIRDNPKTQIKESFLFQVKAINGASYIGKSAIDQALLGQAHYGAKIVIIATNGDFTKSAYLRMKELNEKGFDVRLWNGKFLTQLLSRWGDYPQNKRQPREYQENIINKIILNFNHGRKKSLFIVATGLGKTVIASTVSNLLFEKGLKKILVLCHSIDLAQQLQREFWPQIPKSVPTRLFMSGEPPVPIDGINFGLYQTLFGYLGGIDPSAFDLIVVDEAHHALSNAFSSCINHLEPKHLIGMTATPWRGDGAQIESIFGESIAKVSLIDGMKMGYLAKVDYRLMCDNINWDIIPKLARKSISIKDLNKKLFLPQRDEAVIASIEKICREIKKPKIAIFSPSKIHAEEFARKLNVAGISASSASIDDKVKRRRVLLDFGAGNITALTSVDVLNEGIDVPSVNVLVFLRATHSRRIFVQQLGRGLRLAPGKETVVVLDFVTDIRRLAAIKELDREAKEDIRPGDIETVYLKEDLVKFSNQKSQAFVEAWLDDVAGLEDSDEAEKLTFPESEAFI